MGNSNSKAYKAWQRQRKQKLTFATCLSLSCVPLRSCLQGCGRQGARVHEEGGAVRLRRGHLPRHRGAPRHGCGELPRTTTKATTSIVFDSPVSEGSGWNLGFLSFFSLAPSTDPRARGHARHSRIEGMNGTGGGGLDLKGNARSARRGDLWLARPILILRHRRLNLQTKPSQFQRG